MDRVRSLLPKVLSKRGLKDEATAAHIVYKAQQFLQDLVPQVSDQVTVHSFSGHELLIASSHSVASQEVQQILPELKDLLTEEFPDVSFKGIRLVRT